MSTVRIYVFLYIITEGMQSYDSKQFGWFIKYRIHNKNDFFCIFENIYGLWSVKFIYHILEYLVNCEKKNKYIFILILRNLKKYFLNICQSFV